LFRALAFASVLVGLLAAAPASATSVDRAFSDTSSVPTPSLALSTLLAEKSICEVDAPGGRLVVPSLQAALATAESVLSSRGSPGKLDALLAGNGLTSGGGSAVGVAGLAQGQPGVALLGFLAAYEHDRTDPLPLLDAAVMLSSLGHQPQALALLGAAEKLPGRGETVLGVSVQASIDNAHGVALFRLAQFAGAEAQFKAALSLSPNFSPAERNLAGALLCRGQAQEAVTPYRDSIYVDPEQSQPASAATSSGETPPVPGDALDLSHGVAGTLPALTIPVTADDGADSAGDIATDNTDAYNEGTQADQASSQDAVALSADQAKLGFKGAGLLTIDFEDEVLGLWNDWQTNQPDLAALYAKVQADYAAQTASNSPIAALSAQVADILNSCAQLPTGNQQCVQQQCWPAVEEGHAEWLPQIQSYDSDVRAFASAVYKYATAVASNVTNADEIAAITMAGRGLMFGAYDGELSVLTVMTGDESDWQIECSPPAAGSAAGDNGMTDTPAAAPCPPGLSAVKIQFKFAVEVFEVPVKFDLKVNCDAVEIGVSLPGPISPYGSVKYKFSDGSISVFAGGKGSTDVLENVTSSAKVGVYVDFASDGYPTDIGVQASAGGLSGSWDELGVSTKDAVSDKISLAPYLF
jgi:tetratricopeptide (TPR) repeat protein